MRKRVRMSYMKLVLPLFVVGLLLCALLLALSGFGIRYAFASPVPLDQLQETGLEGAYASAPITELEGTFARYGLPSEEGDTDVDIAQRFCVLPFGEDKYIGVRISDDAQLETVATYFAALEELGRDQVDSQNLGVLTGTINPMPDELYDFFCQWGEQVVLEDDAENNPFYIAQDDEPLTDEQVEQLHTHMLPLLLDVGYFGSHPAGTVYILTAVAALFLLASLALLIAALCGCFDRSVRVLLRREGAARLAQDYAAGQDFGSHLRICPDFCWHFKRVGTEVFATKDIVWAYPRRRRLEGGRVVWLLVMKTVEKQEYSVLLGVGNAVEAAIETLESLCPVLSVGFDADKQKLYDRDLAGFRGMAKKEHMARLAEKQQPKNGAPAETPPADPA